MKTKKRICRRQIAFCILTSGVEGINGVNPTVLQDLLSKADENEKTYLPQADRFLYYDSGSKQDHANNPPSPQKI